MKASIKLFTSDGKGKNGKYPIKLIIKHSTKTKRKTISSAEENTWDKSKDLPKKNHPQYYDLYAEILRIKEKSESIEFYKLDDVKEAFDFLFLEDKEIKEERFDFYKFAEDREQYMRDQKREGNADAYKYAISELKNFMPELYWDEINPALFENFKIFKKKAGTSLSGKKIGNVGNRTLRAYIHAYSAIYRSGIKLKSLPNNNPFYGVFDDLNISKRRVKNVYIDKERIKILETTKMSTSSRQRCVDLLLLQFYLGGCDFMDLCYIKKKDYKNGRVWFRRTKLGDKSYLFDVKVFDKAKALIDKYKVDQGEYLFPFAKISRTSYQSFRRCHNRLFDEVFKELKMETLPLNEPFRTKSVRHTFQTIGKFEFVDPDIIRELVGHERTDMDTVYKDKYPEEVRDAGHFKIIDTTLSK